MMSTLQKKEDEKKRQMNKITVYCKRELRSIPKWIKQRNQAYHNQTPEKSKIKKKTIDTLIK